MFEQKLLLSEVEPLRKFAMRLTRNPSDAEDLTQSTILRALEKKGYFEEGSSLFKWTSKIMFNLFISEYRHKKKFYTQYDPSVHIDEAAVEAPQEAAADLQTVSDAMELISDEHREVLILVCVKGLRYAEVSEKLQIPVGTVRSRLSRARQQLKNTLEAAKATHAMAAPVRYRVHSE